jgi:glutathione synthase
MKVGILMDPISEIHVEKDTNFALLLEAQSRGHDIFYMESQDIWLQDGICWGRMDALSVKDDLDDWYAFHDEVIQPLVDLDVLLMRKDPPFDIDYVYLTYLLEQAEAQGLWVLNQPASLRDANEKLFTAWFPQCCPKTLVTSIPDLLKDFVCTQGPTVIKPLGGMGGKSVFAVHEDDPNLNVIIETMTRNGQEKVMAQQFIPEITDGDKRILLIHGEPVPYALARIPAEDDFRGNLASGARYEGRELSERDYWICEQVGPTLQEKGLDFVGLDVIGDYLTEINVTSPTCVRGLDALFDLNISADLFDFIELNVDE